MTSRAPGPGPRPHANQGVGRLADTLLSGLGVAAVREEHVRTDAVDDDAARLSIRVLSPRLADGRAPARPTVTLVGAPTYGALAELTACTDALRVEWDGSLCSMQVPFPSGTSFYGTGEVAGPLLRNDRSTVLWNTDAWCYDDASPSLYQAHPYVLAVLPDGRAVGLFADTFRRGRIDCAADGVLLQFEGEPFDLYRIEGAGPADVTRGLASLVGRIAPPPRWALGYHQCRWSYGSAAEVRALAAEFRARDIPCAAIWLDIDYMDRCRVFTWDTAAFPDPRGLIEELHAQGIRVVAILDPGVALDPAYEVYAEGLAGEHFVRLPGGAPAVGRVWPGPCHFPDFTAPRTRAWWAERVRRFLVAFPLDGLWNDMNEPSLRAPSKSLPEDALHAGDERTGPGTHARFHNLYGRYMAEATHAGMVAAAAERTGSGEGARPFVLTRANHISGSRFAATWTGDNQSRWEDLRWSIAMTLNLGLSGQPFAGPDVGGFFGDPSPELFVRWFELGAFLPFFRGHAEKSSCRKEPWSFGAEAEAHVRRAIQRREELIPTLVALFDEAARTGLPVVRPLFFADPTDLALRAVDDAFLLGADLLVAPVVEPGATTRTVRLPRGDWLAWPAGGVALSGEVTVDAPLGVVPLFVRAESALLGERG